MMRPIISIVLASAFTFVPDARSTDVPKVGPDLCDLEWERLKSLPPISRETWDDLISGLKLDAGGKPVGRAHYPGVHLYYYLARVPYVIGLENTPSAAQRQDWLSKAAALGHKSAKATLLKQRYLDKGALALLDRPSREQALAAAIDAAEAGDPEFATILMDTARDFNGGWLCRPEDRTKAKGGGCNPQSVVQPNETRKWAEKAAQGGNTHAKLLLCTAHHFGTFPELGFNQDDARAIQWCFAAAHNSCAISDGALLLVERYRNGIVIPPDVERANAWEAYARRAIRSNRNWPYWSN